MFDLTCWDLFAELKLCNSYCVFKVYFFLLQMAVFLSCLYYWCTFGGSEAIWDDDRLESEFFSPVAREGIRVQF